MMITCYILLADLRYLLLDQNLLSTQRFDPEKQEYKRMRWRAGKRLMYGSLLCLSMDRFTSHFLFATIVNSDPDQLEKGTLCHCITS